MMERTAHVQAASKLSLAQGTVGGGVMNADVAQLIDRLEALVGSGRRVPLSAMVMVDEQVFLDIIDQLRVVVPDEIKQARRIIQEKERIISHAQAEADKIIDAAESEASKMVDESEVTRAAQERAAALVAEAELRADELRRGADAYALEALTGLDDELSRLLAQIKRGRAMLERPKDSGVAARSVAEDGDREQLGA